MPSSPAVRITTMYIQDDEPLVSLLEDNLDRREVRIERQRLAIKALVLDFVVDAIGIYDHSERTQQLNQARLDNAAGL